MATKAEQAFHWIQEQFDAGRTVQVTTMQKAWAYKPKHRDMFRLSTINGTTHLETQHGKRWDSIGYNDVILARISAH